ncbi:MAG: cupin domain-containing protein [Bacteroidota bacterium]|nr:cupin domain-containing protein [Bacteroidota bacterium]
MEDIMNLFDEKNWEDANEYFKGTKRKILRDDNGCKTVLLKLPENFYMPPHSHITTEQHFVIKGDYTSQWKCFPEGSYQIFSKGDEHGLFESKNGALILVIWDPINLKGKNKLQLTLKDVENIISRINYPGIKCSLIHLGVATDIQLIDNKVSMVFAFPFAHLPVDGELIKSVSEPLHNLGLDFEYEIRIMTEEEKLKFLKMEDECLDANKK